MCALNPHAGEEELFGDEETRIIAPAVGMARADGVSAAGPIPADTLMVARRTANSTPSWRCITIRGTSR